MKDLLKQPNTWRWLCITTAFLTVLVGATMLAFDYYSRLIAIGPVLVLLFSELYRWRVDVTPLKWD